MSQISGYLSNLPFVTRILFLYYLAIPLFLLFENIFSVEYRIAFPDNDNYRLIYDLLCTSSAVAIFFKPIITISLSLVENSANFLLLLSSVLSPVIYAPPYLGRISASPAFDSGQTIISFLLISCMRVTGIQANIDVLRD